MIFSKSRHFSLLSKLGSAILSVSALTIFIAGIISFRFINSETHNLLASDVLPMVEAGLGRYREQFRASFIRYQK
ncbi:hypothetical protein CCP4SC76_4570010 [Gammaproteobacteria bacterium]